MDYKSQIIFKHIGQSGFFINYNNIKIYKQINNLSLIVLIHFVKVRIYLLSVSNFLLIFNKILNALFIMRRWNIIILVIG